MTLRTAPQPASISAEEAVKAAEPSLTKTIENAGLGADFLNTLQHTEVLENGKWRITFLSEALPGGTVLIDAVTGEGGGADTFAK